MARPQNLASNGDNLGNHTATQDLSMGNKSIVNAANGTFSNILSSATINGTTTVISPLFNGGKFNGESATITGTINGATIVTSGTLTANKIISNNNINGTTIALSTGATAGYVLTSDASGNATWQDLATLSK